MLSTVSEAEFLSYGVDINPHKHGYCLPGSGLPIAGPEFLREYAPEMVVIMNPLYRHEIERDLQQLGLTPDLVTL